MLLVVDSELGLSSLIGLVMLMGIVTKNSILLVEYAMSRMKDQAMSERDALMDACQKRARPIVMTTIAMIAGMTPIALGLGGRRQLSPAHGHCRDRRTHYLDSLEPDCRAGGVLGFKWPATTYCAIAETLAKSQDRQGWKSTGIYRAWDGPIHDGEVGWTQALTAVSGHRTHVLFRPWTWDGVTLCSGRKSLVLLTGRYISFRRKPCNVLKRRPWYPVADPTE